MEGSAKNRVRKTIKPHQIHRLAAAANKQQVVAVAPKITLKIAPLPVLARQTVFGIHQLSHPKITLNIAPLPGLAGKNVLGKRSKSTKIIVWQQQQVSKS